MDQISDLNNLRLFAEVVEHGSYTAAAKSLGLQTSKLSRRVRALEEELGIRLLNRTSRSLSLTETGRQFHRHCLALVAESKAAKEVVDQTRTQPQGTVRISCPVPLLSSGIAEIISRYLEENPLVRVLVDATNRRVDVIEEGLVRHSRQASAAGGHRSRGPAAGAFDLGSGGQPRIAGAAAGARFTGVPAGLANPCHGQQ